MIPKIIHYCWFSKDRKPKLIQQCIESWKRVMPNYQIHCWGGDGFDFDSVPYVRDAMSIGKYAFAADYVRLYALYTYGGIYLDSDVYVYKSFDELLSNSCFSGTEVCYENYEMTYDIEAAIIGSEPNHPFLKECLNYLHDRTFLTENGEFDKNIETLPQTLAKIASQYGYERVNELQCLNNGLVIYPAEVFPNTMCGDIFLNEHSIAKHCNASSWCPMEDRGRFFHFCREHGLIDFYHTIEKIHKSLSFHK